MKIFLFERVKRVHRFFALTQSILFDPLLSLFLCPIYTERVVIVIALNRALKHFCHPAFSILVSPKLAQLLQIHTHVELNNKRILK